MGDFLIFWFISFLPYAVFFWANFLPSFSIIITRSTSISSLERSNFLFFIFANISGYFSMRSSFVRKSSVLFYIITCLCISLKDSVSVARILLTSFPHLSSAKTFGIWVTPGLVSPPPKILYLAVLVYPSSNFMCLSIR